MRCEKIEDTSVHDLSFPYTKMRNVKILKAALRDAREAFHATPPESAWLSRRRGRHRRCLLPTRSRRERRRSWTTSRSLYPLESTLEGEPFGSSQMSGKIHVNSSMTCMAHSRGSQLHSLRKFSVYVLEPGLLLHILEVQWCVSQES